jgi:archaellum component FlaC
MINPFKKEIEELEQEKFDIKEIENEIENFEDKFKEILTDIGDFCDSCPLDARGSCSLDCYLYRWKEEGKEIQRKGP